MSPNSEQGLPGRARSASLDRYARIALSALGYIGKRTTLTHNIEKRDKLIYEVQLSLAASYPALSSLIPSSPVHPAPFAP